MSGAVAEPIAATLAAAAAAWGRSVELIADLSFSTRATVLRIAAGDDTAVAKQHADESARRLELDALRMLPPGTRPNLLAHNDEVIVMSDLGDGPSLADLLLGDDARLAEAALLAWASTLGRIAAATVNAVPGGDVFVPAPRREALEEFSAGIGQSMPEGMWNEVEIAQEFLRADAAHVAFVPSDACPDNTRVTGDAVVLFDFEFSGWMPIAVPAAYCVVPFCSCWCLARLPDGFTERMVAAFCEMYARATPDELRAGIARAGSLQLLDLVPMFSRWLDAGDQPRPIGRAPSTNQQRIVQRLDWIAAQHVVMPATATFAGHLAHAYRERHPSPALPLYPAFR